MIQDYNFDNNVYEVKRLLFDYFTEIDGHILNEDVERYFNNVAFQMMKYSSLVFRIYLYERKPVGFIFANIDYFYNNEKCGYILELFVEKKHRRIKIGKQLVESFEKSCTITKKIYLTSNPLAYLFYENIGYHKMNKLDVDNQQQIFYKELN